MAASAVLLRDVGHVAIADRILHEPGPLSADERALVQLHPRIDFTLIGELPALRDVASAVLYHHERVDGTGYPIGLTDTAIPLAARVVAAVDVYTALIHERPHRPALTPQQALVAIGAGAGTQFDRKVPGADRPTRVPAYRGDVARSRRRLAEGRVDADGPQDARVPARRCVITLRLYTHTLPGELERARDLLERVLVERTRERKRARK